MTTTAVSSSPGTSAKQVISAQGCLGLVVIGAVASGLLLGLALVLLVFDGAAEYEITGAALLALGSGFVLLAAGSRRFGSQPQPWAHLPGALMVGAGIALVVLSPGDGALSLAGWVWPVLLVGLVGWSFRGARHSLHHWSRRAVLYPALSVLLLVAAGGAFESVVSATSSNPPLGGRSYIVNGHRLYLRCVGERTPTVVLFNGLGERTPSWAWVQNRLSPSTRVCAYDRAGEGWSSGVPSARDGRTLSSDLNGLLRAARVPGPYVLAGHSVGGIHALLYAARYPTQIAGIALIDSATPYQFELPDYPGFYALWRRASALLPSFARAGLVRVTSGAGFTGLPPWARDAARAFAVSPRELRANRVELEQLPQLFDEAKAVTSLGDRPIAVVTAGRGAQRGWVAAQQRLARLSSAGTRQTVAGATHAALLEDARFASVTSHAIDDVVQRARSGR